MRLHAQVWEPLAARQLWHRSPKMGAPGRNPSKGTRPILEYTRTRELSSVAAFTSRRLEMTDFTAVRSKMASLMGPIMGGFQGHRHWRKLGQTRDPLPRSRWWARSTLPCGIRWKLSWTKSVLMLFKQACANFDSSAAGNSSNHTHLVSLFGKSITVCTQFRRLSRKFIVSARDNHKINHERTLTTSSGDGHH